MNARRKPPKSQWIDDARAGVRFPFDAAKNNWNARVIINHDLAVHRCQDNSASVWREGAENFRMYHPTDATQPDVQWQGVTSTQFTSWYKSSVKDSNKRAREEGGRDERRNEVVQQRTELGLRSCIDARGQAIDRLEQEVEEQQVEIVGGHALQTAVSHMNMVSVRYPHGISAVSVRYQYGISILLRYQYGIDLHSGIYEFFIVSYSRIILFSHIPILAYSYSHT